MDSTGLVTGKATNYRCFRKVGILNADCGIYSELVGEDDPFSDADMHTAVQSLI